MKKIISIIITALILNTYVLAYTSEFENILNKLNIEKQNVNGNYINEEIYNKYSLFVYGDPSVVQKNQRWKEKADGNFIKNGVRGEYIILGENYSGKEVHNEIFPDDYISGLTPLEWNYIEIEDAEESWLDVSKYQTEKQKEYMLTQNLSRNGVTYDITASKIGLNKARLENYATWKTKGSIFTKKIDENGIKWGATFHIEPMAKDANVEAILQLPNGQTYDILENQEEIEIKINFGSVITNMSSIVSEKDIKSIMAELTIENKSVKQISDKETINIQDNYTLKINKSNYRNQETIEIPIKCDAVAETYFIDDIKMIDTKEITLVINIETPENKNTVKDENKRFQSGDKPKIASIEIKRVTTNKNNSETYQNLEIAKKTNTQFICAGQVIYIRVKTLNNTSSVTLEIEGDKSITTLDELTKKFEWDEPKNRNVKTRYQTLDALKKSYKTPIKLKLEKNEGGGVKYFSTIYVVPYETKQTLNSWNTLREKNKNAFKINENELFTRISEPYKFVLKAKSEIGITTKRTSLDVFETWNTIYNRDLTKFIK